jgi:hypothetical protein
MAWISNPFMCRITEINTRRWPTLGKRMEVRETQQFTTRLIRNYDSQPITRRWEAPGGRNFYALGT